jgi:aspartate aminotransferase
MGFSARGEYLLAMLSNLAPVPPDPILGTTVAFRADDNPRKADLGVGLYTTAEGTTPIFAAVKEAEQRVVDAQVSKDYVSPPGNAAFMERVARLILGDDHPALAANRVGVAQTTAGSGALRVAAGLILRAQPATTLWLPAPSWGNHQPLLGGAGLAIRSYPYYDQVSHTQQFDGMVDALDQLGPTDVVLLQGSCHNPSGSDLSPEQWAVVADLAERRGFTPLVDIAYQGLATGLAEDVAGTRLLAERLPEVLVAYSCSKNFGLYRERAGLLLTTHAEPDEAAIATGQMANVTRELYSMPPAHGAEIVAEILGDDALRTSWDDEVAHMRDRLNGLRALLVDRLRTATDTDEFDYIGAERGMFSFLGFTADQVQRLQREFGVYAIPSSRINVAGVTEANVDHIA